MFDHDRPPHVQQWQTITNAVPIPTSWTTPEHGIPVRARIEWEHDGPGHIDGLATRWTRATIYVEWTDPRLPTTGAWLRPSDVRRR